MTSNGRWSSASRALIAVVAVVIGAILGFGGGYLVEHQRTHTEVNHLKSDLAAARNGAPSSKGVGAGGGTGGTAAGGKGSSTTAPGINAAQAATLEAVRTCLASHGVRYPTIAGGANALAGQLLKPPAGVSATTYNAARRACVTASP
jgi:hypothetical protein